MACFTPDATRLTALIGDAVLELPTAIVRQLENVLIDAEQLSVGNKFMTHMTRMHYPMAADGSLWDEPGVPPERNETLAQVSRSLRGLGTVLHLLSAGITQQRDAGADQLGEHVLQGLLLAGRELVDSATDALHHGR